MMSRPVLLRVIRKYTFVVGELLLLSSSFRWPAEEQQTSGSEPLWVVALPETPTLRRWGPLGNKVFGARYQR